MTKVRWSKKQRATAYHEAGHAVMALLLGRGVRSVTVIPDEWTESLGMVTFNPLPAFDPHFDRSGRTREKCERLILILLAGPVAERRYTGKWCHSGADGDRHAVVEIASRLIGERTTSSYVRWLSDVANEKFDGPFAWPAVRTIAAELLRKDRLSGRRVREIWSETVKAASTPPKRQK
jgi:ATP-dependent Zn protease